MINLNKLAEEIHAAAVEKGFWDVEEALEKHVAKMHSELSEAVQEDRCGRPLLYVDDIDVMDRITDPAQFDGRKPEGVAAELADFVMMALDWAKQRGEMIAPPEEVFVAGNAGDIQNASLAHFVNNLHEGISLIHNDWISCPAIHFAFMVHFVDLWLKARGIDLWQIVQLKMEYNKSRPALHGRLY